jgi:drug/metabolite transporter (DMT)-like permease
MAGVEHSGDSATVCTSPFPDLCDTLLSVPKPMHKTRLRPGQLAILLMLAATGMTAVQNTMIRLLADSGTHPFQIAFFRCVFGFISVAALVLWQMRKLPQTRSIGLLGASGVLHMVSMLAFFFGLSRMPLNDSAALTFATPLFGTIGAALFLGERVHASRWFAICIGFIGVLIVLRPGTMPLGLGPGLVLASTVTFAGVTVLVKRLSDTERATTIVFYQSLFVSLLTLVPALLVWTWPPAHATLMLISLGLLGTAGWLCFTRAFALADASAILPLEFVRLPCVALLAYALFGEVPDRWVWLGAAIIFASTLYVANREHLAHRSAAAGSARSNPGSKH